MTDYVGALFLGDSVFQSKEHLKGSFQVRLTDRKFHEYSHLHLDVCIYLYIFFSN